jgi:TonB-linked SusC/RagA family outer membrane protein
MKINNIEPFLNSENRNSITSIASRYFYQSISFSLITLLFLLLTSSQGKAQQVKDITGVVLSSYNQEPLEGVVVSIKELNISTQTDVKGRFILNVPESAAEIHVWFPNYFETTIPTLGKKEFKIILIPENRFNFNPETEQGTLYAQNPTLLQRNFKKGSLSVEDALQGQFSGLNVINKSGMPGEGAAFNLRGVRSFEGENTPLIVINGVPYMPGLESSSIIGSYSRSVFNALNINDIQKITLLKGPETALYGSLGSNGVLLIETSAADDMETTIIFSGQYGVAYNNARLPVLNAREFKSYIGDVGLTQYDDMGEMLNVFPFLKDDPNYYYNFLYNQDNDWQSMIYKPAFVTDNHLRVKGGDAVAKYDLSVGMLSQGGTLDNSNMDRYSTRMNGDIVLGRNISLFATVGLSYMTSKLHEQGMLKATNPLLTALNKAPILSPYTKDEYNHILPTYDVVRQFRVSNPLAVLNTMDVKSDVYDVFFNTGMNYKFSNNLTLTGQLGLYSNYNRESTFVPGRTTASVLPLENGIALNTARSGSGQVSNLFYNLNANYQKLLGQNKLELGAGYRGLRTNQEFDSGHGRNTSSDFYKTLSYVSFDGRYFQGYNEKWNWMSVYGYANYQWNGLITASAYLSSDGASSTGEDTNRFGVFPGGSLTWHIANISGLDQQESINRLDFRAGYSMTGNTRFSSSLSKSYYSSQIYRQLSGIVVGNVPNTELNWEKNHLMEAAVDVGLLQNRVNASLGYYNTISKNLVYPSYLSSVSGTDRVYLNGAEIKNYGFEVDLSATIIEKRNLELNIGGTLATNKNVLKKMGNSGDRIQELSDGSALISRVGSSPYSYYGYSSKGVISSAAEAAQIDLVDFRGNAFEAGDIHFEDINEDGVIDRRDRKIIGDPSPKLFGGGYFNIRYKQISLTSYFNFSYGNEAYNGVRRHMESLSDYGNQSSAVLRRWKVDGQITDMPRAMQGDPMENSRFSNRWIEDASFLRLSNLTVSYKVDKKTSNWFN